MTQPKRGGHSLIELAVAMALGLVILGLILALYSSTVRQWSRLSSRAEVQQTASAALGRLAADARMAAAGGTAWLASSGPDHPSALGLIRLADVDADGRQIWEQEVIVYSWIPREGKLWRRTFPWAADHPTRVPTEVLGGLAQQSSRADICLASGVTAFEARLTGSQSAPCQPLSLKLSLQQAVLHAAPQRFSLEREVFLRNAP